MSQRFGPIRQDPFPRPSEASPAVTVSERVALSLRAMGAAGQAWLAGLPAARGWHPVPDHSRLPTGAEAARWHAASFPAAAGDPQQALEMVTGCRITGVDAEAIWQWAYVEPVSTGLHVRRLGDHEEAETFLAVVDRLAAATAQAKADQTGLGEPLTPLRVTGERRPTRQHHRPSPEPDDVRPEPAELLLMVGLPGAGKTTRAKELAAAHRALRLTPDEWMISLFDGSQPDGKRDLLEGRLIALALQALELGTNVVLDFGLWSRDERSALRWLATSAGASCHVIYLPVDIDVQRARIAHRQAAAPHTTFPMTDADMDTWRKQFQAPDAAELRGGRTIPDPPPGWPGWPEWAAHRWPSHDPSQPSAATPTPQSVGSPTSVETGPTTSSSEPPSIRRAPKKKGNSARRNNPLHQ